MVVSHLKYHNWSHRDEQTSSETSAQEETGVQLFKQGIVTNPVDSNNAEENELTVFIGLDPVSRTVPTGGAFSNRCIHHPLMPLRASPELLNLQAPSALRKLA